MSDNIEPNNELLGENETEGNDVTVQPKEVKKYKAVTVNQKLGRTYFDGNGINVKRGDKVIAETQNGLEYAVVYLEERDVNEDEITLPMPKIVRFASAYDLSRIEANKEKEIAAFNTCLGLIERSCLPMKLVDCEYSVDCSRLTFFFTAEDRVDFRELVKDLASEFKTRIDLRQIGIRDEAKLIGGLGPCGRPFCCSRFQPTSSQMSIKMAKEQGLSMNSVKISGSCNRLMCCLKYEHEQYKEAISNLPKVNSIVGTPDGDGVVIE
ncbi:MAG: hypothetical protein KBT31_00670, partial [Firmicutes bacterium]|nr:hypothetical protein [Candidatus Colimorpha enterica]